jgi:hypothetical protein
MQDLDCEARSIRSTYRSLDQSNSSSSNSRFNILRRTIPILNKDNDKRENNIFSNNTIKINNISDNSILSVDSNDENKSKQLKKTSSLLSRRNRINPVDENSDNFSNLVNITTTIVNDAIIEHSTSKQSLINSVQSSFLIPKKLTVMVVDDSAMNRKIVRRTIDGYRSVNALTGYQVVIEEADDGLTAIEKFKAITSDNNSCADLIVLGEIFVLDLFSHMLLLMCMII